MQTRGEAGEMDWRLPWLLAGREGLILCPVGPWSPGSERFPEPGPQLTVT